MHEREIARDLKKKSYRLKTKISINGMNFIYIYICKPFGDYRLDSGVMFIY